MKVKSVEEIKAFLDPYAESVGVSICEIEFKQGKNPSLTIYIDKVGGVDLDACESFHNAILEPIDQLDPTYDLPYTLNVSSLGADRAFKTDEDFLSRIGKKVEVKLKNAIKSKKFYEGILLSYDKKCIVIKVDEKTTLSIELNSIVKVNDYIEV